MEWRTRSGCVFVLLVLKLQFGFYGYLSFLICERFIPTGDVYKNISTPKFTILDFEMT